MPVSAGLDDEVLDWRWKGFPALSAGLRVSEFVASRPSLFDAGFSWPIATLSASAIDHNVGVLPRGAKTTGCCSRRTARRP